MKNRLLQKTVTSLLLMSVVLSLFVLPLGAHFANAEDVAPTLVDETNKGAGSTNSDPFQPASCDGLLSNLNWRCLVLNILWLVDKTLVVTLLNAATFIFEYSVSRNLVDITASAFVQIGWGIVRDVANLFFIFILLWIALATIFDIPGYGAKDILRRLIIAALLINFSLAIGGFVINFTNALGRSFLNATTKAGCTAQTGLACGVSDKLLAFTYIQKATTQKLDIVGSRGTASTAAIVQSMTKGDQSAITTAIYQALWLIIMIPILSFVFFAAAIFFLARYLMLSILLVLGPFVFLFMILPDTKSHWNKWWSNLLQWSFFAPVFLFFLFLTILTFNQLAVSNVAAGDKGFLDIAIDMILIIILMIINLLVAQQMGIYGASMVTGWGNRASGWVQGAAKRGAIRGLAPVAEQFGKTPVGQFMARTPGLRALTQPSVAIQKQREELDKERANKVLGAVRTTPPEFAAQRLAGESRSVQEAVYKSANPEDIERVMKGFTKTTKDAVGNTIVDKSAAEKEILKVRDRDPKLAEKIENSIKDIQLKVVASKGVALGTPVAEGARTPEIQDRYKKFQQATNEYLNNQSENKLKTVLTPENIKVEQVENYMLNNFGAREAKVLAKTTEQLRAFTETMMNAVEKQNKTAFRTKMQDYKDRNRAETGVELSDSRARFFAFRDMAPQSVQNPSLQRWISSSPAINMMYKGVPLREREFQGFGPGGGGNVPPATGGPAAGEAAPPYGRT